MVGTESVESVPQGRPGDVIDQRTRTPDGPVPPEDIIGGVKVENGELVVGSYRRNPRHLIFSADGLFRLDAKLHQCLLQELAAKRTPEPRQEE
ncbi:MAG: hypothetical protein ACRDKW_13665 [Actinomycetota bacterium]